MAILDFIYIIPMFMLFSYLPTYGFWSGLLNLVIIVLVGFGLAYLTRTIISLYKKRKTKNIE
ncbi:hypothetical protein CHL76_12075 [Marinococcus halophilus]|nr:hypothetical protein CHL76_12075 [Marinococcus halophilus]